MRAPVCKNPPACSKKSRDQKQLLSTLWVPTARAAVEGEIVIVLDPGWKKGRREEEEDEKEEEEEKAGEEEEIR